MDDLFNPTNLLTICNTLDVTITEDSDYYYYNFLSSPNTIINAYVTIAGADSIADLSTLDTRLTASASSLLVELNSVGVGTTGQRTSFSRNLVQRDGTNHVASVFSVYKHAVVPEPPYNDSATITISVT